MKYLKVKLLELGLLCIAFVLVSFTFASDERIKGWFLAGSTPEYYKIGLEDNSEKGGKVAYLRSTRKKIENGFGTIMQNFEPTDFLGKKVKLTGSIKSSNLDDWAGMWMRVDGNKGRKNKVLAFDNMQDRPIRGTTDWTDYEIILEVPTNAKGISYGVFINGTGKVLIHHFNFEILTDTAESTGNMMKLKKPTNTNFDEYN
ncbi:hypothetical protein [Eudoraea chungangensis]|uniref:hypothetical protein n=1 Tax=Eudoraea chungangensis TaxID=1481905 RepID=UPI0023EBAABC|nr:hypothetical protein [Eudoraea chungangensis]